ncbi:MULTISPECIES: TetR/AcrR family transcriptional regulator [Microbispora]|uniref:TetR/AcrR family transcriptional regulator n=1 Tax=Microbispora hainanensis TaxID=568844 RepID=A0ABZ1SIR0_9ACTN|nr:MULTISPECIES: TetR/AcrR family transcriptional regulator [Microbispora]
MAPQSAGTARGGSADTQGTDTARGGPVHDRGTDPARGGSKVVRHADAGRGGSGDTDGTGTARRGRIDGDEARRRILDAAERLFYAQGIQAVGMDQIRDAAGVSLKRLYQSYPSKDALVEAYLEHRDRRWTRSLDEHVARAAAPGDRVTAVFGFLAEWFGTADFRGCSFINAFGELGPTSPPVAAAARAHKNGLRERLGTLAAEAGAADPDALADQLLLLVEGAIVAAAMGTATGPAERARSAALALLSAARRPAPSRR